MSKKAGDRETGIPPRVLAVGGGKGGVGKSVASIVLAATYATSGRRVVLMDLDLGAANLHTYLGLHGDTPGVADFLLRRVPSLEDLLLDSSLPGVRLLSGARFYPGMANLAYQTKAKLIRHIKGLNADVVIMDLGAGVHFNVLDFFGISRPGLVTLAPEPGSVLNAYAFLKSGLFRHLTGVFGKHPDIRPLLENARVNFGDESTFNIDHFRSVIRAIDPDIVGLVEEVANGFKPALVMNQVTDLVSAVYADNLQKLVHRRLGLRVHYLGNLPSVPGLSRHLVDLPRFLNAPGGAPLMREATTIIEDLETTFPLPTGASRAAGGNGDERGRLKTYFGDEELQALSLMLDHAPDSLFEGTKRSSWKLRLFYKPTEVVRFLLEHGIKAPVFFSD